MNMAKQTEKGKAFEYACLLAIYNSISSFQQVQIENNSALSIAEKYYIKAGPVEKLNMDKAANAAIRVLIKYEPQLKCAEKNQPLYLSLQEDARGIAGDVRDVLCVRFQNNWEIGLSCKHNHNAVKHSRLSNKIDFGQKWFGKPCSTQYFEEIQSIFEKLKVLETQGVKWREITNKEDRFYVPILIAFSNELLRLDKKYPEEIPQALVTYLLGSNDFYKIIARDSKEATEIVAYNLFGTLNRPVGKTRPVQKACRVMVPHNIYDVSFKDQSKNTIIVTCDSGWAISLRIHNARSLVEPSLKFDVNLIGRPDSLGTVIEYWD